MPATSAIEIATSADLERHLRAVDDARERVAAEVVGAERVRPARPSSRSASGSFGSSVQMKRPKSAVRMQKPTIAAPTMPIGLRQRAGISRRRGTASQAGVAVAAAHETLILGSSRP